MTKFGVGAILILILAIDVNRISSQAIDVDQTVLELPPPDGPYAIGTTALVLSDTLRHRELLVTAWYPCATPASVAAPYADKRTAAELATEWELQPGFERRVRTHAWPQAAISKDGPFPVVFLEHGSGVVPATYTTLAEGLASHGYVVVATNHPPDSLIAVYPDGHELKAQPYWPLNADRRTQGVAIGKFAEDVLVADVRFVLDQFQELNAHDNFWRGHLDFAKVGIVGHSMGGTTAALATKEERRISVGVNLDGSTFPGMNADVRPIELHKPLLFMATEEHASDPNSKAREYIGSEANTYYVVVSGNDHMSFSDKRLLQARFSSKPSSGKLIYEHALLSLELTRSLVQEFLDKYLKGKLAPELDVLVRVDRK
jgi:S-formylglutathione hydrolase FrmB